VKKINKIIIWVLGLIIAIFISCGITIALYGKKIIVSQIERNLKTKASLGDISLSLPFTINLTDLELGNFFAADRISATPNILSLFTGKMILGGLTIINPTINLEHSPDGSLNLPKLELKGKQPPILLTGLVIKNGKFIFLDKRINSEGYRIIADKINGRIYKVMFPPTSKNIKFDISACLIHPNGAKLGDVSTLGWIDFGPKDMDANLETKDLDITYFAPYYGNFISNRKLLSAKLNLSSTLKAENNDLAIVSNFRLSDLLYAKDEPPKEGELPGLDLAKNTLDLFTDEKGNLNLDFTINTKLDKPSISIGELKKTILKAAVKNLANQPPEKVIEKITNTIEQFKEFGKELKDIFKKK